MEHMKQSERSKILGRLTDIAHKALHIQEEAHGHPVHWDDEKIAHEVGYLRRMIESLHDEARTYAQGDHPSDPPPSSETVHDGKTRYERPFGVSFFARRLVRDDGEWWWRVVGRDHRCNGGNDERFVDVWAPGGARADRVPILQITVLDSVTPKAIREWIDDHWAKYV